MQWADELLAPSTPDVVDGSCHEMEEKVNSGFCGESESTKSGPKCVRRTDSSNIETGNASMGLKAFV